MILLRFPTEVLVLVPSIFHLTLPWHDLRPLCGDKTLHGVKLCLEQSKYSKYNFYLLPFSIAGHLSKYFQ